MSTSSSSPSPCWADQPHLLRDLAIADLEGGGDVLPSLIAFSGEQALFLATLRPFGKGGHREPIIEVGAVAVGLNADRLLLSLSGRAWSTVDPIPPVLGNGEDLRQRVITLHDADGTADPATVTTSVIPFDVDSATGRVTTGPPLVCTDGHGWVPRALSLMVVSDHQPEVSIDGIGAQIQRCERLGHRLAWSVDLAGFVDRLHVAPSTDLWSAESRAIYRPGHTTRVLLDQL